MKFTKTWGLAIAALLMLVVAAGCGKEEDNEITINIISPTNDQVVANKSAVLIHVEFDAEVENHNVEVLIHNDDDVNDVAFTWDEHDHDKKIILMETIDLSSYPSGTKFHMEVEACKNHDCKDKVFKDIEFSIP